MSAITGKIKAFWVRFRDKEYRDAFVASRLRTGVAYQIAAMREDRGWTQAELAAKVQTAQPRISRVESGSEAITLSSALKIASAFDVAVELRFIPHSEFIRSAVMGRLDVHVPCFDEDTAPEPVSPLVVPTRTVATTRNLDWRCRPANGPAYGFARPMITPSKTGEINGHKVA